MPRDPDDERDIDEIIDLLMAGPAHPKYGSSGSAARRRHRSRRKAAGDYPEYSGTVEPFIAFGEFFNWFAKGGYKRFHRGVNLARLAMGVNRIDNDDDAPDPIKIELYSGDRTPIVLWATTVPITEEAFGKKWRSHGPFGQLLPSMWTSSNKKLAVYREDPQTEMRFNPYLYVGSADVSHNGSWWTAIHDFLSWMMTKAQSFGKSTSSPWLDLIDVQGTKDTDPHFRLDFSDDDDDPIGTVWMIQVRGRWPGRGHIWHRDCPPGDCYPEDPQSANLTWPQPDFSSANGMYHFFIDVNPWETVGV